MLLSCDPYYKRHLQEVPDEKQKSSAPEIEQELKTAFELYSKVCFFVMFIYVPKQCEGNSDQGLSAYQVPKNCLFGAMKYSFH